MLPLGSMAISPAHAGDGGGVAAGIVGGLAAGTLLGIAASGPHYYGPPPPAYYGPPPEPVYGPACYWTRGQPYWDGYGWIYPRVRVCE
jgi:hypothetical protein